MTPYALAFNQIDSSSVALVGGKGAHLGELSRIEGVSVPAGFCVTTCAFQRIADEAPLLGDHLDRLSCLTANDQGAIRVLSSDIRRILEKVVIPDEIAEAIGRAHGQLGEGIACAVRSSATAEDSPTASFAGQQDTYLNVLGRAEVLRHVSRCWASLFTERAVTYRLRNGFTHGRVRMAVVVQRMVFPRAAGILFTADPITGNRKVTSVEASFGLGETLVSGLVNADIYKVRDGAVITRTIGKKLLAIHPSPSGGTQHEPIGQEQQEQPALTDAEVLRLEQLGRRIEAHFGHPQDVEWCVVGEDIHIVQSRPITTLFPIPAADDGENHVYLSVGHGQMMTDAMKPLGISVKQLVSMPRMHEAGGRLFVDVTPSLGSPAKRSTMLEMFGKLDLLTRDALQTLLDRVDFIPTIPAPAPVDAAAGAPPPGLLDADPTIVAELIARNQASVAALKRDIQSKSGPALLEFIFADIQELRRILFDRQSHRVFMTAIDASGWLNEHLEAWLGGKNVADTLTRSVPDNITSEMGLALLDVADTLRPHPEVVALLERLASEDDAPHEHMLEALAKVAGGPEARHAIEAWLERYGMRGVGEIDITRPRWSERPNMLVPLLLGNIKLVEPGAGARRFEQGRQEALKKEQEVLDRLRALPDGTTKAEQTKKMIDRVRTFIGYREYPKYGFICRYFIYKQALLKEAERLVLGHVLRERDDVFFLTLQEIQELVRTHHVDDHLIDQRKEAFRSYGSLTPPRVLTSEGECLSGAYRRDDLPAGSLVGLAVSAGTIEGRARVIREIGEVDLEAGDILVTAFTDPSWTPLFVAIAGLVTEVGGLMTHGAVIAREYGLPAVVGVENATTLLKDGQRIRVDGTNGYIEIL